LRRQLPFLALGGELDERLMEGTSSCLDHFGVVEILDVQKDWELETDGRTVNLKRDANLRILLASRSDLDVLRSQICSYSSSL
jgi:hypothetical protein